MLVPQVTTVRLDDHPCKMSRSFPSSLEKGFKFELLWSKNLLHINTLSKQLSQVLVQLKNLLRIVGCLCGWQ